VPRACPQCANPFLVDKYTKTLGPHISCPNKECDYKEFPKSDEAAAPVAAAPVPTA